MDVRGVRVKAFQGQELRASLFSLATVDSETQDRPAFAFVSSSSPFQAILNSTLHLEVNTCVRKRTSDSGPRTRSDGEVVRALNGWGAD